MSRWSRRVMVMAAVVAFGLVVAPSAAAAGTVVGCTGTATSFDQDGKKVDSVVAAGGTIVDSETKSPGATAGNPFEVDGDGTVAYTGKSDSVITDHHWHVDVEGITVKSGGSQNAKKKTTDEGTVDVSKYNPLGLTGLVHVSGDLKGTGGSCTGSGFVKITGNPFASPLAWLGLGLGILGLVLVVLSLPTVTSGPAPVPPSGTTPPEPAPPGPSSPDPGPTET